MKVKVHNPANLPTIDYRKLQPLQGNLKDFHEREYEKLKKSLKEFGWVYPFFVWDNAKDGIKYLIDGHGRHRLATREGVQPYELPYYPIHAADLQEAKKLLLVATSQYQRITQEGFDEFTFDVDDSWLAETVNFDGVFSNVESLDPEEFGEEFELPDGDREPFQQMTFTLSDEQAEFIKGKIADAKKTEEFKYIETFGNENSNGNALYFLIHGQS